MNLMKYFDDNVSSDLPQFNKFLNQGNKNTLLNLKLSHLWDFSLQNIIRFMSDIHTDQMFIVDCTIANCYIQISERWL